MSPRRTQGPGGAPLIIGATVAAGVAGYVVTWLVYRHIGPAPYALFAIFWAALYLVIGGLSGIQQEITRATRAVDPGSPPRANRARTFGVVAAVGVATLVVATAPLWQQPVFAHDGWQLAIPLAVGAGAYVMVATLSGSLYGLAKWRAVAALIALDGVLRVLLVGIALAVSPDVVVLAWSVVLPFPLAIVILWPVIRRGFVGRSDIDVGYRALAWNVARTVLASVSTAVLVSGFPLVLGAVDRGVDQSLLGELIFTLTLTRAPLIVTILSLQGLLLIRFRDTAAGSTTFRLVMASIAGGAIVLGLAGWAAGVPVLAWISGRPPQLDGTFIALLVASSALVAALCVTAAAVLAAGRHAVYVLAWVLAAVVTILVMVAPLDFLLRVDVALIAGPLAGLAVHLPWLLWRTWSRRR